jgi:protein TonB
MTTALRAIAAAAFLAGCADLQHDRFESTKADYVRDWQFRVARQVRMEPPDTRIGGFVRFRVVVLADGRVESFTIERSSHDEIVDRAATALIRKTSPFPPFPAALRERTGYLVIFGVWVFSGGTVDYYPVNRELASCRTGKEVGCLRFGLSPAEQPPLRPEP